MSTETMRSVDRFNAAFRHEEPDRVPIFETIANTALFKHYLGVDNLYGDGGPHVAVARAIGLDSSFVHTIGYTSLISRENDWKSPTEFVDELGVPHVVSPASWPLAMASGAGFADREAWEKMPRVDPLAEWRYKNVVDALAAAHRGKEDDLAVVAGVRGAFTVMFIGMGFENMAFAVYDDPDLLREMSAYFTDFWTKVAVRNVELGADAIFIANDMGFNTNTLLSPETMRDIFLPDLKKQVAAIHDAGGKVILHSCGCVNPILPELVDTGIDALNDIQVGAGMDIAAIKKQYGDRLTLIGNVDATNIMTTKHPEEIDEAVKYVLRVAGKGGGLILASDHSLHGAIPVENIERFIAAAKKYGKYPLAV